MNYVLDSKPRYLELGEEWKAARSLSNSAVSCTVGIQIAGAVRTYSLFHNPGTSAKREACSANVYHLLHLRGYRPTEREWEPVTHYSRIQQVLKGHRQNQTEEAGA